VFARFFLKRLDEIVETNLSIAFKNKNLKKKVFSHCGQMIGTFASLPYIKNKWELNLIGVHNLKSIEGPAVIISAHIGQIWLAALAADMCKVKFYHSYRTLEFDELHGIFEQIFKKSSPEYFLGTIAENNAKGFIKALQSGNKIILLADQHSNGVGVPFFGENAKIGTGVAKLALKFKCPIIPIHGVLTSKNSYTIHIEKPLKVCDQFDLRQNIYNTTRDIAKKIESWICENPDQYWWLIKRWPRGFYK
jgi:KDO2-lipid IV(A) lauroyltransferase